MNMSVEKNMPTNCGMKSMHGNGIKKVAEQNMSKINEVANKESMSKNNSTNSSKTVNTEDEATATNLGEKFDARV